MSYFSGGSGDSGLTIPLAASSPGEASMSASPSRKRDDPGYGSGDPSGEDQDKSWRPNEVTDAGTKVNAEDDEHSEKMPVAPPPIPDGSGGSYTEPNGVSNQDSDGYDSDSSRRVAI